MKTTEIIGILKDRVINLNKAIRALEELAIEERSEEKPEETTTTCTETSCVNWALNTLFGCSMGSVTNGDGRDCGHYETKQDCMADDRRVR